MPNEALDQEQSNAPYRALYKDSTDNSAREERYPDQKPAELSPEQQAQADEAKNFAAQMAAETGFDIAAYLEKHPEKADEAKRLGFIE